MVAAAAVSGLVMTPHLSPAGQSVRRVRVACLLAEELEEFLPARGAELEGNPTNALASKPDAKSPIDEGTDSE